MNVTCSSVFISTITVLIATNNKPTKKLGASGELFDASGIKPMLADCIIRPLRRATRHRAHVIIKFFTQKLRNHNLRPR